VIYHCNADYDIQMASTLTVALLYKRHLYVASVGDSRAYSYNATKGLQRITADHTLAAHLVEAELLQPAEIYTSAKRHQHYRSLGQTYQVRVDVFEHEVEPNDLILLCTDGLWHMVHDEGLAELLSQGGDPQQLARTLVDAANDAGGEGNASAIVACVQ
jgi:serine/threonine protein phosphatase PrpC